MPKTRLISPGIANHSLKKNLTLNGHWISNDGEDEGIKIDNEGVVEVPSGLLLGTHSGAADVMLSSAYADDQVILKAYGNHVIVPPFSASPSGALWQFWDTLKIRSNRDETTDDPTLVLYQENQDYEGSLLRMAGQQNGNHGQVNGIIEFAQGETDTNVGARIYSRTLATNGTEDTEGGENTDDDWPSNLVFGTTADGAAAPTDRLTITHAGNVGIGVSDADTILEVYKVGTQLKLSGGAADYATFAVAADGEMTITTVDADAEEADIILVPNGEVKIDRNSLSTTVQTTKGLEIDYDHTGSTSNAQTMIGLDINTVSGSTTGGSQTLYGSKIYASLTAASGSGVTDSYGLHVTAYGNANSSADDVTGVRIDVTGTSDNQTGLLIDCVNGGDDFKIISSAGASDYFLIQVGVDGETTFTTNEYGSGNDGAHLNINLEGNFSVDADGDITLDADGDNITMLAGGTGSGLDFIQSGTGDYTIKNLTSDKDIIFNVNDGGSDTEIMRLDGNTSTLLIASGKKIAFADSGETISSDGTDLTITSGSEIVLGGAVGFTKIAETFSDDSIVSTGATDDTHIDFRATNKISLAVTGDITNMNLIFPVVSGNFILLLTYNGDHDVTNWKVYESDASAADGDADVLWPGGTAPATTSGGADIFSFFWDGTAEKCYGVGSLDFSN